MSTVNQSSKKRKPSKSRQKKKGLGLGVKLAISFIIVALIPLIILSSSLYLRSRELFKNSLENTMEQAINEIENTLYFHDENLLQGATYLSQNDLTLDLASKGENQEALFDVFDQYIASHPQISNIYVGTNNKDFYIYPSIDLPEDYDPTLRPWYEGAVNAGSAFLTDPYADASTKKLTLTAAAPIKDDSGKVIGVLGIDVNMDQLSEKLNNIQIGKDGYPVLIDKDYITLTHRNPDLIGQELPVEAIVEAMKKSPQGNVRYTFNGEKKIGVYKTKENSSIFILATLDESEISGQVSSMITLIVSLLIFAIIVIGLLALFIARGLVKNIQQVGNSLAQVKDGDLTVATQLKTKGEIGMLATDLNETVDSIRTMVTNLKNVSEDVSMSSQILSDTAEKTSASASEVTKTAEEIAKGAGEQAEEAERGAIMTANLSSQMDELLDNTKEMLGLTSMTMTSNEDGKKSMNLLSEKTMENVEATGRIERAILLLDDKTKEIVNILDTITSIADQTNLLALNASIEAARAGEHGKGFAVVADEIRKLAEDSRSATEDIQVIVSDIQKTSGDTVNIMSIVKERSSEQTQAVNESSASFDHISRNIEDISHKIESINSFVTEMNKEKDNIVLSISNISSISEETAAASEEVTASMEQQTVANGDVSMLASELDKLAGKLKESFNKFKV